MDAACSVDLPMIRPISAGPPKASKIVSTVCIGADCTKRTESRQGERYRGTQYILPVQEPKDRLKWARQQRGFETATDAARRYGWSEDTYRSHENGMRGISKKAAANYARAFRVPVGWLLYAEGSPSGRPAQKVLGIVGAGGEVIPVDDYAPGAQPEEVELPPGAPPDAVPVEVRGDSMWPRYFHGERLFYVRDGTPIAQLFGRECVVKLPDGRMMVKILKRGSKKNLYNLASWNAPELEDEQIEWAAPVKWRA